MTLSVIASGAAMLIAGEEAAGLVLLIALVGTLLANAARRLDTSLCILAFAFPLDQVFYKFAGSRFNLLGYVAALVLFIAARHHTRPWSRTEILAAAWVAWSALSVSWTSDPVVGATLVVTMGCGVLLLRLFHLGLATEETIYRCGGFFIAGTLVMGFIALQTYSRTAFVWQELNQRIMPGALGIVDEYSPVQLARDLAAAMLFGLIIFDRSRLASRHRAIAFAAAAGCGVLLLLTLNRGMVVAQLVAVFLWLVLTADLRRVARKVVPVAVSVAIVWFGAWAVNPEVLDLRLGATEISYAEGDVRRLTSGRSEIWSVGLAMFTERPLLGVGLGSFGEQNTIRSGDSGRAAHNVYVSSLAETGVIGGILVFAFIASLGLEALSCGPWRAAAVAWWALFAAGIAFAGMGTGRLFWMTAGMTLFLARRERERRGAIVSRWTAARATARGQPPMAARVSAGRAARSVR